MTYQTTGRVLASERLIEIGDQVVDVLQSDAEADEVGRDAGRCLLFGLELLVSGACRVDDQRLGITDVRQKAEDLELVDELEGRLVAALDSEADDGSVEATVVVLACRRMVAVARKTRIVDPTDVGVVVEELGDLLRVLGMALDADMEGFQALKEHPRVERRDGGTGVAETLDAGFQAEGHVTEAGEIAKDIPELEAVVARVRLGEVREASAGAPVEVAAVDEHATDGGAVPTNELGGRVDHDVRAEVEGSEQVRAWEGVVDNDWNAVFASDLGDLFKREGVELGVADGLAVDELRLVGDGAGEVVGIGRIDELDADAPLRQGVVEEVVGSAVEAAGGDDFVTGLGDGGDREGLGGLSRRGGDRMGAPFELRDALLEDVGGGVHDSGVDVPELLKGEQSSGMRRVVEHVAGGLVDGDRTRFRVRVWNLGTVKREGLKTLLNGVVRHENRFP